METLDKFRSPSAEGSLKEDLTGLRTPDGDANTTVEDVLREVQLLEKRQYTQSRFGRILRSLEPLLDFLIMYSPAVDMIVQYDPSPSALIWGALKALLKVLLNAARSYKFIECGLIRLGDILSSSVRYEKMFEEDACVQIALKELYREILLFLQRIRTTVSKKSLRLIAESVFRPVDTQFQDNIRRLSRTHEVFKEEVTFAHRQQLQNHMNSLQLTESKFDLIVSQTQRNRCTEDVLTKASIAAWLGHTDWSMSLRRASKKRMPGTGLWLLQDPVFQRWIRCLNGACEEYRLLWVHGLPGAGKTTLSSTIIEHIQTLENVQNPKVAYFYSGFVERSHRTAFSICISAISQLLAQCEDVPHVLSERHRIAKLHGRSRISETDEVFDIFRQTVAALPSVYLVIDALDECTEIPSISSWLQSAVSSLPSLHVMVLSRDTMSIRKSLGRNSNIQMNAVTSKGDIDVYLASAIDSLPCTDHRIKDRVLKTLAVKAEGMFLLADLSMQMLQGATDEEDVENILRTIPEGVNEMYMLILRRLEAEPNARRSLAQRVLRLICSSAQVMTWSELSFALCWEEEKLEFQRSKKPFKDTVCDLCYPLIEYQSDSDTFRLVHYTLYEFLCRYSSQTPASENLAKFFVPDKDAQRELASMTLACMADIEISNQISPDLDSCPLIAYATKHWCEHLSRSSFDENLCQRYLDFVACPKRRSTWILRWILSEARAFPLQKVVKMQTILREWMIQCKDQQASAISVLNDTQRALFQLDKIRLSPDADQTTDRLRLVSNFERLMCVRDLAREYTIAGAISHGVDMFESALREAERLAGSILTPSCWLLNSLGILYDQQGKTHLSKETQTRALAIQEKWLPPDHLDIVLTVNELGRVARHLGDFEEAESLHRRALRILQSLLPESDLQIVWTKNALGRALLKQGSAVEAIGLHQQVLAIEEGRLGRDHPHTLWTLSDIARCHHAQNDIASAITVQREVVERSERSLGANSPDTLWAKNSLGNFHELIDQIDIARVLHAEALAGQTECLGADHSHTAWSRQTLARLQKIRNSLD